MSSEDSMKRLNILYFSGENEEEHNEWHLKSMAIAKSYGWYEATVDGHDTTDSSKKKIDDKGVTHFAIACTKKAFQVMKNEDSTAKIIAALDERHKETEIEDYMSLLEAYACTEMKSTSENPEDWMMKIDDLNQRMKGISAACEKSEDEMKTKILAGLPEEHSEVATSEKKDMSTRNVKQIKKSGTNEDDIQENKKVISS